MNVKLTVEDTERLKGRLLPVEEWDAAPKNVQTLVGALKGAVGLAYDVTFGWCVVKDGDVVFVQRAA